MTTVYTRATHGQLTHTEMDANINNLNSDKYESGSNPSFGTCTATNFNTGSDERYKKDIIKIEDSINKIKQINGYDFVLKASNQKSSGVIAQELQKVMPHLVHENDEGMLVVEYGNMIGLLIEAIKTQQKEIEKLKEINYGL